MKETLESEIKVFAIGLPYWAKYLAKKILSGNIISENEIDNAYSYLLEELKLIPKTEKSKIVINYNANNSSNYKHDLLFMKLENIEGVNALVENQVIEFSPNLTVIYGANGSGKSGYVRLLKKVFYSKTPEEIISNIYLDSGQKAVKAEFTFKSNNTDIHLLFPADSSNSEFDQYAVFDGKSVIAHLDRRNELKFRPAGLSFFADLTEAIKRVEEKLNVDVTKKQIGHSLDDLVDLFEGESDIKTIIQNLSAQTKLDDLRKYTPFSEEDKTEKSKNEKKYDNLLLAIKGKIKEIQSLESIRRLIEENKKRIEILNKFLKIECLTLIKNAITDCVNKEETAKSEGIENFKTDKIEGIGSIEWKKFIVAAEHFAKKQKEEDNAYPKTGDNCLLCHQPLSEKAQKLINNYWAFIKSVAEENAKKAQAYLDKIKSAYEELNFNLFPDENILSVWLSEKYPSSLTSLKQKLTEQKTLASNIISDINSKISKNRLAIKISVTDHDAIETAINASIKMLKANEQNVEIEKLLKVKTRFAHKEKFNIHFPKFETYVNNQVWIQNAGKAIFGKKKITETEKTLSEKYFNQKYIETFNNECNNLNGNFGIEINHTGSAGKSYKQLILKGNNPNVILSEGEKKVIAIADFLAEMNLSEVNRGLVFDDPVSSLDEMRKKDIAIRLSYESKEKQVVLFTHDLIFVSNLLTHCEDNKIPFLCHWIENRDNKPGHVWLKNAPSYEKEYRNSEPVKKFYIDAKKDDCPPSQREFLLKSGFTALRTCYEVLVINGLFKNVVQRYNERVSVDALSKVYFDQGLVDELLDSFANCCRYMEGHTHSNKYAYKKPQPTNLNEEIQRYEAIRKKIKNTKKTSS